MALGQASRAPQPTPNARARPGLQHSSLAKTIALVLLALIVLIGLVVLITWLAIRPKKLVFSVDEASIHGYNLTSSKLNSTFDFTIRVYNPNHKVSVYYETLRVTTLYHGQELASRVMEPFFQGHKVVTRIRPESVARNVGLDGSDERTLKKDRTGGAVSLTVKVKGKIRFRVGRWKSGHYRLKVKCSPVVIFSDSRRFQPTKCDVDI